MMNGGFKIRKNAIKYTEDGRIQLLKKGKYYDVSCMYYGSWIDFGSYYQFHNVIDTSLIYNFASAYIHYKGIFNSIVESGGLAFTAMKIADLAIADTIFTMLKDHFVYLNIVIGTMLKDNFDCTKDEDGNSVLDYVLRTFKLRHYSNRYHEWRYVCNCYNLPEEPEKTINRLQAMHKLTADKPV